MTQREAYVRGHVAWLTGETDTHPGGMAGKRWIIDRLKRDLVFTLGYEYDHDTPYGAMYD